MGVTVFPGDVFEDRVAGVRAAAAARDGVVRVDGFEVAPLDPDRFEDFVTVLGRGGISGCWCMYWIAPSSNAWAEGTVGGSRAPNRNHFRALVGVGPPPGLIAYDDEQPIAWCRVMPRHRMPGLANSRHFKTDLDIEGVWALSCFVVKKSHRGRGLTTVLTKAAISFVDQQGASALEVYPWDTEEPKADSTLYTGVASTFERLGFEVVQRRVPHKPMMRLSLTGPTN